MDEIGKEGSRKERKEEGEKDTSFTIFYFTTLNPRGSIDLTLWEADQACR